MADPFSCQVRSAVVIIILDTCKAEGRGHDGGVNSYAPGSGVAASLGLPLISVVTPTGVPILFTAGLVGEKSELKELANNGSASTEFASPAVAVCQSASVVWAEPE